MQKAFPPVLEGSAAIAEFLSSVTGKEINEIAAQRRLERGTVPGAFKMPRCRIWSLSPAAYHEAIAKLAKAAA